MAVVVDNIVSNLGPVGQMDPTPDLAHYTLSSPKRGNAGGLG